jgi:Na+/H+ antiporter NhaD/arsenite permease-like protein
MFKTASITLFLVAYFIISQEHRFKVSKTAISMILAVVLWVLIAFSGNMHAEAALLEAGAEIFRLVVFLLSAMTLVEILTHYGLFDAVYVKMTSFKMTDRWQFFVICLLAFIFSAFLDNLTTTIVFLQIAQRFFTGKNLLKAASAIVIAANAGGAFSPVGDVTTTMLWLANKFDAVTVVSQAFLPSLVVFLVATLLIGRSIKVDTKDALETSPPLRRTERIVVALCLATFVLPLVATWFSLPPYTGLLFGLGVVWLFVDVARQQVSRRTSLAISIETFFQKTDIGSIFFFIGILIAVAALREIGILEDISRAVFGPAPVFQNIVLGNVAIGGLSAIFDNVPLTAAAIDIVKTTDPSLWTLLAITVGVGGSILLIGSAPGIIAMAAISGLNFLTYMRIATIPALVAYAAGVVTWVIQHRLFIAP